MGIASGRRVDLADGRLDIRIVHGGRRPVLRLLAAALAGPFTLPRLRLSGLAPGTLLTSDGEATDVEGDLLLEEQPEAPTVYRPPTESLITRQSIS